MNQGNSGIPLPLWIAPLGFFLHIPLSMIDADNGGFFHLTLADAQVVSSMLTVVGGFGVALFMYVLNGPKKPSINIKLNKKPNSWPIDLVLGDPPSIIQDNSDHKEEGKE